MGSHERALDAALLRATATDPAAFDAFYERYERPLLAYFRARTRDPELTADLTAEVFAAVLEHAYARIDAVASIELDLDRLLATLPPDQRAAVLARIVEERLRRDRGAAALLGARRAQARQPRAERAARPAGVQAQGDADMTVLPALRASVLAAATRRAQAAAPAPRRRRRLRAGLLAFGAIAVTGTALAATGAWNPQVGDDRRGHPTISGSAVPGDQLAHFGVLRRPATDADRGAKVRYALRYLDARSFAGVRTDAVRLVSTEGNGYVLIPTEEATLGGQAAAAGAPPDDSLCLFAIDSTDGGGLSCWTTEQILAGRAVLFSVKMAPLTAAERAAMQKAAKEAHGKAFSVPVRPRTTGEATVAGLVPDGVATVEAGAARVRVPVADNFFVAHVREGGVGSAPYVRWLDPDGKDVTPR